MRLLSPFAVARIAQHPLYWDAIAKTKRLAFTIGRWSYALLHGLRQEQADSKAVWSVLRDSAPQLFLSLVVAGLAQGANPFLQELYQQLGWKSPDDGIYGTLLGGVASIGAVFIGLYYAGISAIGSSAYAQVSQSVRDLLVREQLGSAYMRFLAFLTFFSLSMLCLRVVGYERVDLVVPFVTLLSGLAIFGFVRLGQRTFYLFDPVTVSYTTFQDLQRLLRQVRVGGFRWNDQSFQSYARRQATECLDAIDALYERCAAEPQLAHRSRLALLERLQFFLGQYQLVKGTIPTETLWYARVNEYADWYRSDDTVTGTAHETSTTLHPKQVVDHHWIEARLVELPLRALRDFVATKNFDAASSLLQASRHYLDSLTLTGQVPAAISLLERIGTTVLSELNRLPESEDVPSLEVLGLTDLLGSLAIDLCLNYRSAALTIFKPLDEVQAADVARLGAPAKYKNPLPIPIRERLEWLSSRLSIERQVEGESISPTWYVRELLAIVAADMHKANVEALHHDAHKLFLDWSQLLAATGRVWLNAALASRHREYNSKVRFAANVLRDVWDGLLRDKRVRGLPWPSLDFGDLATKQTAYERAGLPKSMSLFDALASAERPQSFPDYLGQFLHATGEETFDALLEGDIDRLTLIFPHYFVGCLRTFTRLLPGGFTSSDEALLSIQIAAGSLLDLLTLSGYARLMAEFHDKFALWDTVEAQWSAYLSAATTPPRTERLANVIGLLDRPMTIPMRGILRTTWNRRAIDRFESIPRSEVSRKGDIFSSVTLIRHPSALVRVFADTSFGHSRFDGKDIFVELYLRARPDAAGCEFPADDLARTIERQTQIYERT